MTTQGISHQGEGCSRSKSDVSRPTPAAWTAQPLVPLECVSLVLTIHQGPGLDVASVTMEVKDAHSKELLSMRSDPCYPAGQSHRLVEEVSLHVRRTLLELLDPEPF